MALMTGKNVFITGGSRGIGFATAREALLEDANAVAICSHYDETREAALKKLNEEFPGRNIVGYTFDLETCTESVIGDAMKDFIAKFPDAEGKQHLDAVCSLAGITHNNTCKNIPEGLFEKVVRVNLIGTWYVDHQAALIMRGQKYGSIVNTASIAGVYGSSMGSGYGASKGGVIGLTRSLGREMAFFNVRVNAICPGVVKTDMVMKDCTEAAIAAVSAGIAMRRMGEPSELAKMFIFLCSDNASYCEAGLYHVDGWTT